MKTINMKKPSVAASFVAKRKAAAARVKRARSEMKDAVARDLKDFYPNFKADVWGEIEIGNKSDFVDLMVAGYDGKERRIFLVAVSLTHMFAPHVMRIDEAKSLWRDSSYV